MDAFEKLLLVSNMSNNARCENDKFMYGFISGAMSCIIILIFVLTYSNRGYNANGVYMPYRYNAGAYGARGAYGLLDRGQMNLSALESFINYG